MKSLAVLSIALAAAVIGAAVWFSPLSFSGASMYENNEAVAALDGFCYPDGITARADFTGSEADMYEYLDNMLASPVKTAYSGGSLIVYAYSPRVSGKSKTLSSGEKYNVMAAYKSGTFAIGTPVLEGCF